MKITLINCAVASDGGSIALQFETNENDEYWVTLDNGLESPTHGKIFTTTSGELPLTREQEQELLPILEEANISIADCEKLLLDIIRLIKCR